MIKDEELEQYLAILNNPVNAENVRKLLTGNKNWIDGNPSVIDQRKIRTELIVSQDPKTIILTCADSRVSPEYIFDANIGDLFVIRVAGNVVTPEILASIEFGISELNSTLLCILGHENCGAIQSKIRDQKERFVSSNNLLSVLNRIKVNVDETLTSNVIANIKTQSKAVKKNSYVVDSMYSDKTIDVVGLYYSLETGKVTVLDVRIS